MTAAQELAAPRAPAAATRLLVHVRVGSCDIGIPVDQVLEALPMPAAGLHPLPRRDHALSGLITSAGSAVPVIALDRWLPLGARPGARAPRVLVLGAGGARVGIEVDEVLGVKAVAAAAIRRLVHGDGGADELFESIAGPTASIPLLSVLEVERAMALSAVWCAGDGLAPGAAAAAKPRQAAGTRAGARRHAVFRVGATLWAIEAAAVRRVAAAPVLELSLKVGGHRVGICQWEGRKLPVVSIDAEGGADGVGVAPMMAVIENAGRRIGLAVTRCEQLVDVRPAGHAPVDQPLVAGTAICGALGRVAILDHPRLFDAIGESACGLSPAGGGAASAGTVGAVPRNALNYLVFETERLYASASAGVAGVVSLPAALAAELAQQGQALLDWRGRTIEVRMLPALGDGADTGYEPRLAIVMQVGTDADPSPDAPPPLVALAVRRLVDWIPATADNVSPLRLAAVGDLRMLTLRTDHLHASLVLVDLAEMAHLIH